MDELELKQNEAQETEVVDTEVPLDKNLKMMSPGMMVVSRFFSSRLSIVGLIMVISLFLFSFIGPLFVADTTSDYSNDNKWGETELDRSGKIEYSVNTTTFTVNGVEYTIKQTTEKAVIDNFLQAPSGDHLLGTDDQGYDVLVRLMYGGRISLIVSFLAVFLITIIGTDTKAYTVDLTYQINQTFEPGTVTNTMVENNVGGYQAGDVLVQGITGYSISTYLTRTDKKDPTIIEEILIAESYYAKWDQVIVGDSDLSLNTRSEAKAIQAHHRFWLFPPNSHRTQKKWLGGEAPIQDRWRATQHLSPTAQPVPAGATILKELARLAALPP